MREYDIKTIVKMTGSSFRAVADVCKQNFTPMKVGTVYKFWLTRGEAEWVAERVGKLNEFVNYVEPKDEQMKEDAHPLVTDKRWLKLTEFPNVEVEDWEI